MIITAIAAMDRDGLIGAGGSMPWHLPRDLRRFREHTVGKPVIMGRRTFQSLRAPLKDRLNIVLTRDRSFRPDGCRIASSVGEALAIAAGRDAPEVMIIGGGVVFEATVGMWDRLLITVVEGRFSGDAHFPGRRVPEDGWEVVHREFSPRDDQNSHDHWFYVSIRARRPATTPSQGDGPGRGDDVDGNP